MAPYAASIGVGDLVHEHPARLDYLDALATLRQADIILLTHRTIEKQVNAAIALIEALRHGRVVGEAQNFTRTLVNEPGTLLTPTRLAAEAKTMAEQFGLECEILDEVALAAGG